MIQKFVYKRATMEDIDELVRTRIIVLRAANKLPVLEWASRTLRMGVYM